MAFLSDDKRSVVDFKKQNTKIPSQPEILNSQVFCTGGLLLLLRESCSAECGQTLSMFQPKPGSKSRIHGRRPFCATAV